MKSMIRVVLVDPLDESRQALHRLLGGISSVWIAAECSSYDAAVKAVNENAPDLTLIDLDAGPDQAINLLQSIAKSNPSAAVLPASRSRDSDMILRVVRAGAHEFLTLPAAVDELLGAIERLIPACLGDGAAARRGSLVIAVTGTAGGVGCTTIAVNLAAALAADPEQTVVLADFDLLFGAVDACLDVVPDQTVLEVAQNVDRLDLTLMKRTLTRHSSGLYLLPHPVAIDDVAKINPDALRRVVSLLRAAFHMVVIDTSKALQASDFVALEMADVILLVAELELACLRNTARLLQLLRQYPGMVERVRLVLNRIGSSPTGISQKKAEETLKMPVSWQIPNMYKQFIQARSKGITIEAQAAGCRAHRAIVQMARDLDRSPVAGESPPLPSRSRLASFFF